MGKKRGHGYVKKFMRGQQKVTDMSENRLREENYVQQCYVGEQE